MAAILVYVDPDAVGGGTGVDWTNAYTSMNAAEAARQQDLTDGGGDTITFYCRASSGTNDANDYDIDGWTTAAANWIRIEAASTDRAGTTWDATKYRVEVSRGGIVGILESDVRIDGIQYHNTNDTVKNLIIEVNGQYTRLQISNCYFNCGEDDQRGIELGDGEIDIEIWNCICASPHGAGASGAAINVISAGELEIYNCSISQFAEGITIDALDHSGTVKNCAVFACTDDFVDSVGVTIDYCASDDGDGTNSVAPSGGNWANEFNDHGNGDFTLLAGGNCKNGGTDNPGAGLFLDDIDGETRSSPWDIGADELLGGPKGPLKQPLSGALGGVI
jgi:hypothetical protein